jgi:hypothetical protein
MRAVVVGGVAVLALVAGCHPAAPTPSSGASSPAPSSSPVEPPRRVVPAALVSAPCLKPDGSLQVYGVCQVHVADPKEPELLVLQSDRPFQVYVPAQGPQTRKLVERGPDGMARTGIPVSGPTDVLVSCVGAAVCQASIGDAMPDVSG